MLQPVVYTSIVEGFVDHIVGGDLFIARLRKSSLVTGVPVDATRWIDRENSSNRDN
ncbi:MAG: hypothetical protein GPOALKHO_001482 [Sodalis sp.]|nr:MAG: hypothetical protein GPOALKHO_001482 [Sodalis sp.]